MKIGDRVTCYRNNFKRTYAPLYLVGESGVVVECNKDEWIGVFFDTKGRFYLPPSYLKYEVKEQKNG